MKEYSLSTSGASLHVCEYGVATAPPVILLHGGPGMVGYMESLGRLLADRARILDYYQRGATKSPSSGPFLISDHVADLKELISKLCPDKRPLLVGHSWGAILGLEFCAEFPGVASKLCLIGCGPLDLRAKNRMVANIDSRLSWPDFVRAEKLSAQLNDTMLSDAEISRLDMEYVQLITPVYQFDPKSVADMKLELRPRKPSIETGVDYSQKRNDGRLIESLKKISDPVVAFHGSADVIPHEGVLPVLREHLSSYSEYVIPESGHTPWLEPNATTHFMPLLMRELLKT